eukprot:Rhum_TRINITY_DN20854_c0_g1::Rhum_TRINITY_DN20854_c0_g1_i1::g.172388::m.172388
MWHSHSQRAELCCSTSFGGGGVAKKESQGGQGGGREVWVGCVGRGSSRLPTCVGVRPPPSSGVVPAVALRRAEEGLASIGLLVVPRVIQIQTSLRLRVGDLGTHSLDDRLQVVDGLPTLVREQLVADRPADGHPARHALELWAQHAQEGRLEGVVLRERQQHLNVVLAAILLQLLEVVVQRRALVEVEESDLPHVQVAVVRRRVPPVPRRAQVDALVVREDAVCGGLRALVLRKGLQKLLEHALLLDVLLGAGVGRRLSHDDACVVRLLVFVRVGLLVRRHVVAHLLERRRRLRKQVDGAGERPLLHQPEPPLDGVRLCVALHDQVLDVHPEAKFAGSADQRLAVTKFVVVLKVEVLVVRVSLHPIHNCLHRSRCFVGVCMCVGVLLVCTNEVQIL